MVSRRGAAWSSNKNNYANTRYTNSPMCKSLFVAVAGAWQDAAASVGGFCLGTFVTFFHQCLPCHALWPTLPCERELRGLRGVFRRHPWACAHTRQKQVQHRETKGRRATHRYGRMVASLARWCLWLKAVRGPLVLQRRVPGECARCSGKSRWLNGSWCARGCHHFVLVNC